MIEWTLGQLGKNKAKQTQTKPNFETTKNNANSFTKKGYENKPTFRLQKTNPNKPNACPPSVWRVKPDSLGPLPIDKRSLPDKIGQRRSVDFDSDISGVFP